MKEFLLIMSGLLLAQGLMAQVFQEWFEQNSTQLKYLRTQIAALQLFQSTMRAGYSDTEDGLGTEAGYSQAESDLHAGYFRAFRQIDLMAAQDPGVQAIANYCRQSGNLADAIEAVSRLPRWDGGGWATDGPVIAGMIRKIVAFDKTLLGLLLEEGALEMDVAGRCALIGALLEKSIRLYESSAKLFEEIQAGTKTYHP